VRQLAPSQQPLENRAQCQPAALPPPRTHARQWQDCQHGVLALPAWPSPAAALRAGRADGGALVVTAVADAARSQSRAAPSLSGHGGAVAAPPSQRDTVAPRASNAGAGGVSARQAETSRSLSGADGLPPPAVVGGASGVPPLSSNANAVPRPPAAEADLVFAPTVHLYSGPLWGGVEAELSAGHLLFVDGADYVTARNLVMRLLFGITDFGTRLIRLACLPGGPDEAAETATGGPTAGTPAQRVADQQAYKRVVAISQYSELWGFNKANLRATVEHALHLAELN